MIPGMLFLRKWKVSSEGSFKLKNSSLPDIRLIFLTYLLLLFQTSFQLMASEINDPFGSSIHMDKNHYQLSGYVYDQEGEALVSAYLVINPGNVTTVTNDQGYFKVELEEGTYTIECQYLSMVRYKKVINLSSNLQIKITLNPSDINLEQVVITARPTQDINSLNVGSSYLDLHSLNKLPSLLGETDVIRSITTLPGVVNSGEASSGFYVRGGGADQNLILLDDVPVFNTSHLFGFFSVYNPSILNGYTLYRSGGSAKYGGRISSILDVRLKNGDMEKMNYFGEVSPTTLSLEMDGPLAPQTSIVLAGRFAYPNYILHLFNDKNIKSSKAGFYDGNFKIRHVFSDKDNMDLSAYASHDWFKFPSDTVYHWSNYLGRIKWNHIYSHNLSSNLTLAKSDYENITSGITPGKSYDYKTGIDYSEIKVDFNYNGIRNHEVDFGAGDEIYKIQPGELITDSSSAFNPVHLQLDRGSDFFAYLNDQVVFNSKFSLGLGLRGTYFMNLGPSETYVYQEGIPKSYLTIIDTLFYSQGQVTKSYWGIEPRISAKYSIGDESSLKASYNRTRQYIQIVSNTATITPVDVWKLANRYIKPQYADQFSLGYFYVKNDKSYEMSWEIYYRLLHNQVDYKDGAVLTLNPLLESDLLFGKGYAYGSEWFLRKNTGSLTGWLSLSLSRAFRLINGATPVETINNGIAYPSDYDKPVNVDLFLNYKFPNSRWSFSTNANYTTGRPITAADSWFLYSGTIFSNYTGRNQERMPDYERLDISFNYDSDQTKRVRTTWNISVYNLLFRKNAYSAFFKHYYGTPPMTYKLAVIGVAVPSLSFGIYF